MSPIRHDLYFESHNARELPDPTYSKDRPRIDMFLIKDVKKEVKHELIQCIPCGVSSPLCSSFRATNVLPRREYEHSTGTYAVLAY